MLLKPTADYIKYYIMFGIFFCGSMTLSTFVRNDNNPRLAFWGMITGAVSNIFLDWLFIFVFKMGITGAAVASGLGQLLACIILSTHFIAKKGQLKITKTKLTKESVLQILKIGMPEFVTQMSQPITILCYNYLLLKVFGEIGVSAFSVISYILVIIIGVFIGLAQGIQPLLSKSFGEKDIEKNQFFFYKGLKLNVLLAFVIYAILILFGKSIISIFNTNPQLIKIAYKCISIYGISFLFASINIVITTYYLSTKQTTEALIIATLRSFVTNIFFIFLMPLLFGINAIWTGMIIAEVTVLLLLALSINNKHKKGIV